MHLGSPIRRARSDSVCRPDEVRTLPRGGSGPMALRTRRKGGANSGCASCRELSRLVSSGQLMGPQQRPRFNNPDIERRPREEAADGADCVAAALPCRLRFQPSRPAPSLPHQVPNEQQRTQAPESVDTGRASRLDPLENNIGRFEPFA
jgi:hypothetical protein